MKTLDFLALELAGAVGRDEEDGEGFDISAGMFGPHVSAWLRGVAEIIAPGEASILTHTRCAVCLAPQFDTPAGICCPNGHGGAASLEEGK